MIWTQCNQFLIALSGPFNHDLHQIINWAKCREMQASSPIPRNDVRTGRFWTSTFAELSNAVIGFCGLVCVRGLWLYFVKNKHPVNVSFSRFRRFFAHWKPVPSNVGPNTRRVHFEVLLPGKPADWHWRILMHRCFRCVLPFSWLIRQINLKTWH